MSDKIINLEVKRKYYRKPAFSVAALEGFTLEVIEGESVAIIGESGVGKSTLLNILGLIDPKFDGRYHLLGQDVAKLSESEMATWRNRSLGFVLQESALINSLSIRDNITLPFLYSQPRVRDWQQRYEEVVDLLAIGHIVRKKPLECSGGEKARANFARAVMLRPRILLADEPTASLDPKNRERILSLLFGLSREHGATIVTVTHDLYVADRHERVLQLSKRKD